MSNYNDYVDSDFSKYMAKEKIGSTVNVTFKMPIPTENGLQFPGSNGKLLAVFGDGLLMRSANAERFFAFKDCHSIDFPSEIALAQGPMA
jgi:hypothetical protein